MKRPWLLSAALLGAGSLLLFALPPTARWALAGEIWQPLTAGLAHWNALHLAGNLAGLAAVAWLGERAGCGPRDAAAWLLAGPLTAALLLLHPQVPAAVHYAGLSGWLHAGVAIAVLVLLRQPGRPRLLGAAIGLGLLTKLLLEQPWGALLQRGDWWGGSTLPLAHAAGAAAGWASALLLAVREAAASAAAPSR